MGMPTSQAASISNWRTQTAALAQSDAEEELALRRVWIQTEALVHDRLDDHVEDLEQVD
jgi:hypothetical protein